MKKKEYKNPEMKVIKVQNVHLMEPSGNNESRAAASFDDASRRFDD